MKNRDLKDYHFLPENKHLIEFDKYGRPYIQEKLGKFFLSSKIPYKYTK